jgi:hypothetical protein
MIHASTAKMIQKSGRQALIRVHPAFRHHCVLLSDNDITRSRSKSMPTITHSDFLDILCHKPKRSTLAVFKFSHVYTFSAGDLPSLNYLVTVKMRCSGCSYLSIYSTFRILVPALSYVSTLTSIHCLHRASSKSLHRDSSKNVLIGSYLKCNQLPHILPPLLYLTQLSLFMSRPSILSVSCNPSSSIQ